MFVPRVIYIVYFVVLFWFRNSSGWLDMSGDYPRMFWMNGIRSDGLCTGLVWAH